MGSQSDPHTLPDADSPALVLTHPTEAEKNQTWSLNHGEWGGALSLQEYLDREPYLTTIPLSADGGMTHWILSDTHEASPGDDKQRPVLASCESIRKRVLYVPKATVTAANGNSAGLSIADVREGTGYGVCSVYTYPHFRGRRYAGRMMGELGPALRTWPHRQHDKTPLPAVDEDAHTQSTGGVTIHGAGEEAVCSALWSDIGKKFYAKKGWVPFPSSHVEIAGLSDHELELVSSTTTAAAAAADASATEPITYANLSSLCAEDELLLCELLLRHAQATGRTSFAFAPDHDALRWHLYRDEFIAKLVFPDRAPSELKGCIARTTPSSTTATAAGTAQNKKPSRVWAIWTRNYAAADPASCADKNTLYILRLVIEDERASEDELAAALRTVLDAARREAGIWHCGKIHMWNPTALVQRLLEQSGIAHQMVERDTDSIPSLMWYGDDETDNVEWVASEKYCWC
ncbi:hypothetical protein F5Y15DRAFT_418502 [Xylariaceae sp. FL0016]|nr:hypothetical protein F5Y15DRAFT_418502 [Xylariaceae sp. FL0016]